MDRNMFIVIMAVILVLQLLLCFKTKRKLWKLLPILALLILFVVCIVNYALSGWNNWAFLIPMLFMAMPLGAVATGWVIYGIVRLTKKFCCKEKVLL